MCTNFKNIFYISNCRSVYDKLVSDGTIVPKPEVHPPTVPMDYSWAQVILIIKSYVECVGFFSQSNLKHTWNQIVLVSSCAQLYKKGHFYGYTIKEWTSVVSSFKEKGRFLMNSKIAPGRWSSTLLKISAWP